MSEEKILEECRAVWESTKPDAVFADFWLGWKARHEYLDFDCGDDIPEDRRAAVKGVKLCAPCGALVELKAKGVRRG